ncbi:acetyl-CoA carboxylase, carboxyl transferase, beta subunit [Hydrogenobaculum sp. Y04AAS1]|uniref:Acetyl-coenzyme A carboxylase carboxyl transferase subunit beta n=1 Tax=Hydrogenobaculum sp. (strain Y04AAS1) TaxID=380749 RepID=ACCD_HYDS0|nr:RecName: Full=Acetyl-coenzyme A carboxylase carboxyl transferase subunit beta; Short=ACCase subunit beta; Short=Acetyl-CoA carboxylase carboxyltransferase subunit beta [Hydrogenobaculum sp. Y04AAS1]ACG57516.1 acetyl-CoA carboxylase, carboxyl transferase, beta subunit [Hydrogenobaculum sp. Y04AAS1]HCT66712.1 acetyl-CoA carboxylase carboxyl transferase subunit beta [Hydrogenobaculum sp.]
MGILDFFRKKEKKENLWTKCEECKNILLAQELETNFYVCPKCGHHHQMNPYLWASMLLDYNYNVLFEYILPTDFLSFKDTKRYKDRLKTLKETSNTSEAMTVFDGKLSDYPVVLSVMDFSFIGGSMGSVVGERFKLASLKAVQDKKPHISVVTSGGARMQESVISLMQMAKTSIAVDIMHKNGIPFITVLTNPTTGGVSASFAFLGDVIIAEPKAIIGFAGARVIEQTIKQQLPEDFQTSEFLLKKGMVDMVVHRHLMKQTLKNLLNLLFYKNA